MTVNGKEEKAQRVYRLEDRGHDPSNFAAAMERAMEWGDQIPIGLFYRKPNPRPSLDALEPALQAGALVSRPVEVSKEQRKALIEEFM